MTARIAQRTSGPWHISKARAIEVCAAGGKPIAELWINEDTEVNAAFIVEACNGYDTALEREARLRAQNAALHAALTAAVDAAKPESVRDFMRQGDGCTEICRETTMPAWVEAARAALQQSAPQGEGK